MDPALRKDASGLSRQRRRRTAPCAKTTQENERFTDRLTTTYARWRSDTGDSQTALAAPQHGPAPLRGAQLKQQVVILAFDAAAQLPFSWTKKRFNEPAVARVTNLCSFPKTPSRHLPSLLGGQHQPAAVLLLHPYNTRATQVALRRRCKQHLERCKTAPGSMPTVRSSAPCPPNTKPQTSLEPLVSMLTHAWPHILHVAFNSPSSWLPFRPTKSLALAIDHTVTCQKARQHLQSASHACASTTRTTPVAAVLSGALSKQRNPLSTPQPIDERIRPPPPETQKSKRHAPSARQEQKLSP